jgi:Arc/MetJ-type ribon-helix-helix transcriptional regulator
MASPQPAILVNLFMAKSVKVNQKKRGRPATGRDPVSAVRLPAALTAAVDEWAEDHAANRSEAIRRLVELGLTVKTKARPTGRLRAALVADLAAEAIDSLGQKVKPPARPGKPGRRLRAQELATKAIEKIIDPAAPPEERAQRRRRLTKGPLEFREDRVDLPKAKK